MTRPGKVSRPWTPEEWSKAVAMAERDTPREDIAAALRRSVMSVVYRFWANKVPLPLSRARREIDVKYVDKRLNLKNSGSVAQRVTPEQIEEREARAQARLRQNLTGVLLGDPPPGYSALDQREDRP